MDERLKQVGKNIRLSRKALGWSQEELAAYAGVDRSHMGYIERGQQNMTLTTLYQIADTLKLDIAELLKLHCTQ